MARTDFTNIANALNSLASTIVDMQAGLLAKANAEREEALALRERMIDTANDISDFKAMITGLTSQFMDFEETSDDLVAKVNGSIYGDVPECPYEEFVGFCDCCGTTITVNDNHFIEEGELLCAGCYCADETDEVAETDETDVADEDVVADETADETPAETETVDTVEE